jgi:hypothetical protein
MDPTREPSASVGERRVDERRLAQGALRITLETPRFEGQSGNLSDAGVFFTSAERLRVSVELVEDGVVRVRSGHLVRVQRMSEDSTGYAIEFDRP